MNPLMVIRTNLEAPDFVIWDKESLSRNVSDLMNLISDHSSLYYVHDKYLLYRLLECTNLALNMSMDPSSCPLLFDSWSCWNSTPPDTLQYTSCPSFDNFGFSSDRFASKYCEPDGSWWIHPETNRFKAFLT